MLLEIDCAYEVVTQSSLVFEAYPFRAVMHNPHRELAIHPEWDGDLNTVGEWVERTRERQSIYLDKKDEFLREVIEDYMADPCAWYYETTPDMHTFYFENDYALKDFLALNAHMVAQITVPSLIENDLFLGKYRAKIVLDDAEDTAELEKWLADVFGDDTERCVYVSDGVQKILFLRDFVDVTMVKSTHYGVIDQIEKIISRKT